MNAVTQIATRPGINKPASAAAAAAIAVRKLNKFYGFLWTACRRTSDH